MNQIDEENLISFLRSSSAYPHRPAAVRAVETHISWVFIASPFVFKVKKPVNLGFADFSTLEKRHHFCERELELNRRLCPDVYLEVLPIYKGGDTFSFHAGGEIVEYALKMRELADGWFLDQLLARDAVGEREIKRVVARLHDFYAAENPTQEIEEWGKPECLKISTDENFAQIAPFVGKTISPAALETIRHFTEHFCAANDKLFADRIQQRRILDCHGDLRLDHVHITPEAVAIFDCIEFNDRFRFIDIANDLAFLAMDFDFAGRHDLANLFLRTAASEFDDAGMLKLADFYKCYRAVVRGKVESIQTTQTRDAEEHTHRARHYFQLALRYAISGSEPVLVVIMGRVGTGKSSVARALGQELDWPVFSSDQIRKQLAGIPLTQRTPPELRAQVYSEETTRRTYAKLLEDSFAAVGKRSAAIMDATFSRARDRDALRAQCDHRGVRLVVVELQASHEQVIQRLREREVEFNQASDARAEDLEKLNAAYEAPAEFGSKLVKVSTAGTISDSVKEVLSRLAESKAKAARC